MGNYFYLCCMKLGVILKRLRKRRKSQGYADSIEAIEIVSKIARNTVSRIERGSLDKHPKNFLELATLYGVSVGEILVMSLEKEDCGKSWKHIEELKNKLIIKHFSKTD